MSKYNPFQPNKIVSPGMFTGRISEVNAIEQCLIQAKHGNPQHFLIHGERGIGKSSLLLYVDIVAKGDQNLTPWQPHTKFITASIDLGGCSTQFEIIRAVGRGIRNAAGTHQFVKEKAKAFWNWLSNWEVLGVRFHKENPNIDPQDISDDLVSRISEFCSQAGDDFDGLLLLIDEADQPSVEAGLGAFVKFFTERLTKAGANNVLIGVAGLPPVLAKMRESHESAPRLFETMLLEPLESGERKQVVVTGLQESTKINGFEVSVDEKALELIAELSEGYPHFVQQFAYSAFDHDTDNSITESDVISGAYKENGALSQLGRKYFDEMYYGKIGSDDYRRVLDTMAEHGDDWVSRKVMIAESGVKASTINNALNALKARNIILLDERRQGHYRLPTKSFGAWINAIKSVEERKDGTLASLFAGD